MCLQILVKLPNIKLIPIKFYLLGDYYVSEFLDSPRIIQPPTMKPSAKGYGVTAKIFHKNLQTL